MYMRCKAHTVTALEIIPPTIEDLLPSGDLIIAGEPQSNFGNCNFQRQILSRFGENEPSLKDITIGALGAKWGSVQNPHRTTES